MNEKKKIKAYLRLGISSFILLILATIMAAGIGNGSNSFPFFFFGSSYPFADKYTAGNTSIAADKLEEIDIDWISGNIRIERYEGDTIEVQEANSDSLAEADRVHSYFDNGILKIQYQKSRRFSFNPSVQSKTLHLRIPEKLSSTFLKKVEIDNVSADITVDGLQIKEFSADTVSGNVNVNGAVENFETESVSGDSTLTSTVTPREIDSDTVSGDTTITVPADSQFSIDYDSVSGELSNAFPTKSDNNSGKWTFDTVSGDVTINSMK